MKRILVYGIGNPYRSDDAVGIRIAKQLNKTIKKSYIDVKWGSIDGIAILDEIVGYDRVIFIDSVKTENGKPGNIYKINPSSFRNTHSFSSHGINFMAALEFGKKFDLKMPEQIDVYAIEIEDNDTFSEKCTPKVAAAIPKLVEGIMEEIGAIQGTFPSFSDENSG
jgi:hydrogenase maturation protease